MCYVFKKLCLLLNVIFNVNIGAKSKIKKYVFLRIITKLDGLMNFVVQFEFKSLSFKIYAS